MRIKFTAEDIESLNNTPRKVYVIGGYWLFTRDQVGKLVAELWSTNSENHYQDIYRGSQETQRFYPHATSVLSGIPCILYITGKRVRQYSLYSAKVKEILGVDEIYTDIRPVYSGWEVDRPGNRVHSDIAVINSRGEVYTVNTLSYVGQYAISMQGAKVLIVDYTNTGKGTSKLCIYGSEYNMKKYATTLVAIVKTMKNRKDNKRKLLTT